MLAAGKPLVVDADALNLLAEAGSGAARGLDPDAAPGRGGTPARGERRRRSSTIDSPRSTGCSRAYHGTIVLKGAGTLVGARGRTPGVCERGNPGMATAGTGDVLTGAIAGILAQCRDPWAAARVGVLVHAMAGDAAARAGERGVLASDLARELHHCVNL